jgi:hypothetical protein
MQRTTLLVALAILSSCRQATPAEVGEQSVRDAQGIAVMQASEHASEVIPTVVPESAKGGAIQQAPSRIQ